MNFEPLTCVVVSAMASSGSQLPTSEIGDKAHQPSVFKFPQHQVGKTSVVKRSFQRKWFDRWSWLHYDEDQDLAFCFTCIGAYQKNYLQSAHSLEQTFISTGFYNWKDATAKFAKHEGKGGGTGGARGAIAPPY